MLTSRSRRGACSHMLCLHIRLPNQTCPFADIFRTGTDVSKKYWIDCPGFSWLCITAMLKP